MCNFSQFSTPFFGALIYLRDFMCFRVNSSKRSSFYLFSGSPFHQQISEGALPPVHGDGLHKGVEDKPATFVVDARGMSGEPEVTVDGTEQPRKC